MSRTKVFIDTNVLVYAHDLSAVHHSDSALLLSMVLMSSIQSVIAEQNIIELYRILTNSIAMRGNALTSLQARDLISNTYMRGSFEIIYPTRLTIEQVLQLAVEQVTSAKIFDIRLAALILNTDIDYFATYNTSDFQNINRLNPLTPQQILAAI